MLVFGKIFAYVLNGWSLIGLKKIKSSPREVFSKTDDWQKIAF